MQPAMINALKPRLPRSLLLGLIALLSIGTASTFVFWRLQSPTSEVAPETVAPQITTVTALGRLEPEGEVIQLSAPGAPNGSQVEQLLVKVGDQVKPGQVIVILDARDRRQADLAATQEQVRVAQAKLAQVQAGAKQGEIGAQKATINRLEAERQGTLRAQAATVDRLAAELRNAQMEYQRYQSLYQEGAVSASQRDSKRLTLETARKSLQEAQAQLSRTRSTSAQEIEAAQATLNQITEVRPTDIEAAKAEVAQAQAAVKQAQADLAQAYVRAPQTGVVLEVNTRPGEVVSNEEGIVALGQTQQMMAIAEVYQDDINKIQPGQPAEITTPVIPGSLQGTVDRIGLQVEQQKVVDEDPAANIDARVVEVHLRLDPESSQKVVGLTNLQVTAKIQTK